MALQQVRSILGEPHYDQVYENGSGRDWYYWVWGGGDVPAILDFDSNGLLQNHWPVYD